MLVAEVTVRQEDLLIFLQLISALSRYEPSTSICLQQLRLASLEKSSAAAAGGHMAYDTVMRICPEVLRQRLICPRALSCRVSFRVRNYCANRYIRPNAVKITLAVGSGTPENSRD